jgi:hypothetical protein
LTSKRVDRLSLGAEVFYRRLMSVVDDYGRFSADPRELRAACYPLRIDTVRDKHIRAWVKECVDAGLLVVYGAGRGGENLQLDSFEQRVRAKKSLFDPPPQADDSHVSVKCQSNDSAPPSHDSHMTARARGRAQTRVVDVDVVGDVGGVVDEDERARGALAATPPPDGVAEETWTAWKRHRGKRYTAEAERLNRKHLAEYLAEGYDTNRIVEDSIANGWSGLFRPKTGPPKHVNGHGRETAKERGLRVMDEVTGTANGNGSGRTISGTAERVDQPLVPALPDDLRESTRLDVGRHKSR